MISDWHKSGALPKKQKPARTIEVKPRSLFKPARISMPKDFPALVNKHRLEGWGKCTCISKAGATYDNARLWALEHPELRTVLDSFARKGGPR